MYYDRVPSSRTGTLFDEAHTKEKGGCTAQKHAASRKHPSTSRNQPSIGVPLLRIHTVPQNVTEGIKKNGREPPLPLHKSNQSQFCNEELLICLQRYDIS